VPRGIGWHRSLSSVCASRIRRRGQRRYPPAAADALRRPLRTRIRGAAEDVDLRVQHHEVAVLRRQQ